MVSARAASFSVGIGRLLGFLAVLALLGAWLTQITGGTILGMTQSHLYSDATILALLGIGSFADAFWHARSH